MVFIDLCSQLFSRNNVKVKTNNGILVINNKTSYSSDVDNDNRFQDSKDSDYKNIGLTS